MVDTGRRRRWSEDEKPEPKDAAQTYLRERCITVLHRTGNLRFHPRCYYRPDEHSPAETWPAMIAAVTGLSGAITDAHRTWLVRDGFANPRAHVIFCAAR